MTIGRPSLYTDQMAAEICEWLADGNSLRSWCELEGKPSFSTVFRWLDEREDFQEQYARARQVQAHNDGDRMNRIIEKLDVGDIAPDVARVMMDGLKWTAGKRLPKVYGDKLELGTHDGAPLVVSWASGEKV